MESAEGSGPSRAPHELVALLLQQARDMARQQQSVIAAANAYTAQVGALQQQTQQQLELWRVSAARPLQAPHPHRNASHPYAQLIALQRASGAGLVTEATLHSLRASAHGDGGEMGPAAGPPVQDAAAFSSSNSFVTQQTSHASAPMAFAPPPHMPPHQYHHVQGGQAANMTHFPPGPGPHTAVGQAGAAHGDPHVRSGTPGVYTQPAWGHVAPSFRGWTRPRSPAAVEGGPWEAQQPSAKRPRGGDSTAPVTPPASSAMLPPAASIPGQSASPVQGQVSHGMSKNPIDRPKSGKHKGIPCAKWTHIAAQTLESVQAGRGGGVSDGAGKRAPCDVCGRAVLVDSAYTLARHYATLVCRKHRASAMGMTLGELGPGWTYEQGNWESLYGVPAEGTFAMAGLPSSPPSDHEQAQRTRSSGLSVPTTPAWMSSGQNDPASGQAWPSDRPHHDALADGAGLPPAAHAFPLTSAAQPGSTSSAPATEMEHSVNSMPHHLATSAV